MIAWPFITAFEDFRLVGYVPRDKAGAVEGNSGVTVIDGFDLGSQTPASLAALALPAELTAALLPYLGAKGELAAAILAAHPLALTVAEGAALQAAVRARFTADLRALYNRCVLPGVRGWTDLGDAKQTTIASVAWQYGNLMKRCPKFWAACVHQAWPDVVAELRNFHDRYPTRREAEAKYLAKSISIPCS